MKGELKSKLTPVIHKINITLQLVSAQEDANAVRWLSQSVTPVLDAFF